MVLSSSRLAGAAPKVSWFRTFKPGNKTAAKLFCFPYAGSGPSVYRDWGSRLPAGLELIGVNYPGRESLVKEKLCVDLDSIVDQLVDQIVPLLDRPFIFFGHSMGAFVCYELSRRLEARFQLKPEHIYLSGAGAPHIPEPHPIHGFGSRDFLTSLIKLNGFPQEVLNSPEMIQYSMPILRADFQACETYQFDSIQQAVSPITVFGGESDPRVSEERVAAWRHHAGVSFSMHMFPGDHFFLRSNQRNIVDIIVTEFINAAQSY